MKIKLQPIKEQYLSSFFNLYVDAFPPDERRDWKNAEDAHIFLTNNTGIFNILSATTETNGEETFVGFISFWKLDNNIAYIEHFAVMPDMRGKQLGSHILHQFSEISDRLILEVELPDNDMAKRRIKFYQKSGFLAWDKIRYIQPPYSAGKAPVELMLMTRNVNLTGENDPTIKELKQKVYGV